MMMRDVIAGADLGDWIAEHNPDALLADGFDQAILGICEIHGSPPIVAYDRELCIQILMAQFGQSGEALDDSREAAEEFFEYNVAGAYMGAHTPAFITGRRTPDGN